MPQHLPKVIRLAIKYYSLRLKMMALVSNKWAATHAVDIFTKPHPSAKLLDPPIFSKAEKLQLLTGGINIVGYKWESTVPNKQRLLIAHGFAGNCRKFDVYIQPMLDKGFSVVMYDAQGHGNSGGKRLYALNYMQAIKDMVAVHGAFDGYLGHSLGGLSVMLAMENMGWPKQAKIALVAPATESTTAANVFFSFLKLKENVRTWFDTIVLRDTGHALEWFSVSRILPNSKGEILWVHDKNDTTTPISDVQPLIDMHLKNVTFFLTNGLGHSKIYRNKKVVEKVINFFAE